MKIIKRGQLAILSVSFMIMIAGYINYKYDETREKDLGKTVYVSGNEVYTYNSNTTDNTNDISIYKEAESKNSNLYSKKSIETMSSFKSNRDVFFSELETTYKTAIENSLLSSEQVKVYQDKLNELVNKKHLITTVENLLKAKNIYDIVIVPTGDNYNVVIYSENVLDKKDMAVIEKVLVDELKTDAKKITITEINDKKK